MIDIIVNTIGTRIACIIKVFVNEVILRPMPIIAPHNPQPIKAWIKIVILFFIFLCITSDYQVDMP